MVIGYLMYKYSWNQEYALHYVQSKRYCVSPTSVRYPIIYMGEDEG
jgi:serine/threonine/tyrosine-interacting protein